MRQLNLYTISLLGLFCCLAFLFRTDDILLKKLFTGLSVVFTLLILSAFSSKAVSNEADQG